MRRLKICLSALGAIAICVVGLYGAGLLSITVHEAGHAVAGCVAGGRVFRILVATGLRGGSRTLLYFPFVERVSHLDGYWVVLGGLVGSIVLGTIGLGLLARGRRATPLAGIMIVGTTFVAIGIGVLRYAITGEAKEAADVFVLSHLASTTVMGYRILVGCVGAALVMGSCAAIAVSVVGHGRRRRRSRGPRSEAMLLVAMGVTSFGMTVWFFGADTFSLIAAVGVATYWGALAGSVLRSGGPQDWALPVSKGVVLQAGALLCAAVACLAMLRVCVPADADQDLSVPRGTTEKDLRLAAYWAAKRGEHAEALRLIEEAGRRSQSPGALYDLGTAYRIAGDTELAIARLTEACRMAPTLEACWAQLARAYEQAGENQLAASAWKTAAVLEASNPDRQARARRTRLMQSRAAALESRQSAP